MLEVSRSFLKASAVKGKAQSWEHVIVGNVWEVLGGGILI